MSDVKANQTTTMRISKVMADMYYWMAKEMIERLGEEEGEKAVAHAIQNMAHSRVEAMWRDCEENGIAPKGKAIFNKMKDLPTPDWHRDEKGVVSYCPLAETWSTYGAEGKKLGSLYCQIDYPLYEGFGMKLERPECLTNGDSCCRFLWTEEK